MLPAHSRWRAQATGDFGEGLSAEALFSIIWETLADLLGTSAAAVILRRSARRALGAHPELAELEISLRELEYRCSVPSGWKEGAEIPPALRGLVAELLPILQELTGAVAIRRLQQIPELGGRGLVAPGRTERTS